MVICGHGVWMDLTKEEEEEGLRIGCLSSAIFDLRREKVITEAEEEMLFGRLGLQSE